MARKRFHLWSISDSEDESEFSKEQLLVTRATTSALVKDFCMIFREEQVRTASIARHEDNEEQHLAGWLTSQDVWLRTRTELIWHSSTLSS